MKLYKIHYWNGHQTQFEVYFKDRKVDAVISFLKESDNVYDITKVETL